ncbi:DNMAP1 like Myb domain [Cryptosporidium canis]|uniref:DNMAP1 like Myb domain n=1 Tax=Cryptosporidium canis TaxID=195482 RepID=A0A9D5DEZ4_9CRYT|nr:DNMAP1 like Myb domain [Cryptosporidium canis]
MGYAIREMLGITPSVKIVSQMNEKLKGDEPPEIYGQKILVGKNFDMVSIPISTSIGVSSKQKPTSKWEWARFKNTARNDSLKLFHWSRIQNSNFEDQSVNINRESSSKDRVTNGSSSSKIVQDDISQKDVHNYYFSKFNKHPTIYTFQSDQYNKFIRDMDPDWTEDDTYLLFELCKEFDLRFIIIHDRYLPPSGRQRTLEQLKQRYYSVSKKLVELSFDSKRRALGNSPDPSILASLKEERSRHPYIRYSYNLEQDRNRRVALLESFNERSSRKNAKKIISDVQPRPTQSKKGNAHPQKCIADLIDIEGEIEQEIQFITKLKLHDSFGPKKSGATTVGTLCFQYISSLPRKFSSDVENFLKHFKLDIFPLPFLNIEVAEQYCAMRCDLLILLSTRKKLQRLNSFKHAWQEKLRNAILQNDEFGQADHEEKNRSSSLINSSGRQHHASSTSPMMNTSKGNPTKARGKSIRSSPEQTTAGQIAIQEMNNPSISQHSNNEHVKRDTDQMEKPRKRSKSSVSRFITQQNGLPNQHGAHLNHVQIINGQTVVAPTNSTQNEQFLSHDTVMGGEI